MEQSDQFRTAILAADPALSRYSPLPRLIFHDDFDKGMSGWTELMGNYFEPESTFFQLHRSRRDFRPPMLSNLTMPDIGTHGAMQGSYALKLATRPESSHFAKALKRITWQRKGLYQAECFFTFKPEPRSWTLGEDQFRAFGVSFDMQDEEARYHFAIRYLNSMGGDLKRKWQYLKKGHILPGGRAYSNAELSPDVQNPEWAPDSFEDLSNGEQELCFNETITKINWHYLRWVVDIDTREYVELQCNDRVFDMRGLKHELRPGYPNLECLMNLGFWVEAETDVRCHLFVDSVLLSSET